MTRIAYFDFLRGVAISMVVAIHCFGHCYAYQDIGWGVVVARNVLNVAVPVFFAISGYFLASKNLFGGGYVSFLKKQIPKVYVPVLFCSLPFLCRDVRAAPSAVPVLKTLTCSYSVYYFVAAIIQCYLLLPVLKNNSSFKCLSFLFLLGLLYNLAYTYVVGICLHESWPLIAYAGHFVMWGVFFHIGICHRMKRIALSYSALWTGTLVWLVFSAVESRFFIDSHSSLQGLGQKASAFFLNAFLLEILFHEKTISFFNRFGDNAIYRGVCALGNLSFGIYLTHLFVLGYIGSRMTLVHAPLPRWGMLTLLVTACCAAGLWTLQKVFPKATRTLLGV